MTNKARRSRGLGSPEASHLEAAKHALKEVWTDLERMPATCEGGIMVTTRAVERVGEARAHLNTLTRQQRANNSDLFGQLNYVSSALHTTSQFYSRSCAAPGRAASDRPLFSRSRRATEMAEAAERARQSKR